MNIPLKKQYADWIAEQVRSGRYASETELVEEAIAEKIAAEEADYFRDRRRQAEEDISAGRTVPADEAFFEKNRQRIRGLVSKPGK